MKNNIEKQTRLQLRNCSVKKKKPSGTTNYLFITLVWFVLLPLGLSDLWFPYHHIVKIKKQNEIFFTGFSNKCHMIS